MKTRKTSKWLRRRHQRSASAARAWGDTAWRNYTPAGREAMLNRRLRRGKRG